MSSKSSNIIDLRDGFRFLIRKMGVTQRTPLLFRLRAMRRPPALRPRQLPLRPRYPEPCATGSWNGGTI
jgi:hypothetical protein